MYQHNPKVYVAAASWLPCPLATLHKSSKSSGVEIGELGKVCVCPGIRDGIPLPLEDAVIGLRGTVPRMFSPKVSARESTLRVYAGDLRVSDLPASFADPLKFGFLG